MTLLINKKLTKINNRPVGENSPNLVTLFSDIACNFSPMKKIKGNKKATTRFV
jgi:hypothetical protein